MKRFANIKNLELILQMSLIKQYTWRATNFKIQVPSIKNCILISNNTMNIKPRW